MSQPYIVPEYLLVGTVTEDLLADGNVTTGGTVTYAATVVQTLGWRPVIVTRAAADFVPPAHLTGAEWHILPAPETTTFRNQYYPEGRVQTIGPIAASIGPADIPADCWQATLVHLCPLAQDVDPDVTTIFPNASRFATPQGWLRQWDEQGVVSPGGWQMLDDVLPRLHAVVISIEDVQNDWSIIEQWVSLVSILIVTEGEAGCTLFHRGQRLHVPPRPANPIDPTGAGDVFAAAFFIYFYEKNDLWQAARLANVAASMAIERPGAAGVPDRAEIEAYVAQHPVDVPSGAS